MYKYTSRGLETLATTAGLPTDSLITNDVTRGHCKQIPVVLSIISSNTHTTNQVDGEQ